MTLEQGRQMLISSADEVLTYDDIVDYYHACNFILNEFVNTEYWATLLELSNSLEDEIDKLFLSRIDEKGRRRSSYTEQKHKALKRGLNW